MTHALGVVDASLKLVARETVRDTADHSSLPAVWVRKLAERSGDARRRRSDGGGVRLRRRRRGGARIGDVSYGLAESAAYGSGAGWELERGSAAGAIDKHRRRVHDWRVVILSPVKNLMRRRTREEDEEEDEDESIIRGDALNGRRRKLD